MLSIDAYNVASVILTGGLTVHDLRWSVATENVPNERVKDFLYGTLTELTRCGYLVWLYEPDYGNTPSVRPANFGEQEFTRYWRLCCQNGGLDAKIPDRDNPTLFLECNDSLLKELDKPHYDQPPFVS